MNRRDLIMAGLLSAGGLAGTALRLRTLGHTYRLPDLARMIPRQIGAWRATEAPDAVLPPADALSQSIYDAYLVRGFSAANKPPLTLVIAYGAVQSYRLQLHRPESCYPASGFTLLSEQGTKLAGIPATFLRAERAMAVDALLYWARTGTVFPRTLADQRWAIARAAMQLKAMDGVLVRLSLRESDPEHSLPILKEFGLALSAAMLPDDRQLLFGRGSINSERADHNPINPDSNR